MFGKKPQLSTDAYKGVRDFYPEDMAIQRYIFDVWSMTAESFGYERYDASVLEPSELYRSKSSEEIVNEQTYTFIDRGEREVTLRPEMTPTVARMVAGKRRELTFPLRWYSIPNLFRYERPQRGRLREHWQLNCDIFGADDYTADVEIIALANQMLLNTGAESDTFEIRLNDRSFLNEVFASQGLSEEQSAAMLALLDRKEKINNFDEEAAKIAGKPFILPTEVPRGSTLARVIAGLRELNITNVTFSPSTVRGFTYYTGTVFEFFDTSSENNRSLLGGGRYDNLTSHFGGDAISGVGFGMGDVTMRDFLKTHDLLTSDITAPELMVIPTDGVHALEAQKVALAFRVAGVSTAVDMSEKKLGKKISLAADTFVSYVLILGDDEVKNKTYALKNLETKEETSGTLEDLVANLSE
ncbi:histidine--tRNA ligase [Candidatus Parcubacteria bacterium]|nr:histidine--tRNA ligase [Candidatus Parcubacteria bacterium]